MQMRLQEARRDQLVQHAARIGSRDVLGDVARAVRVDERPVRPVAQRQRGIGRDAVLGVDDVVAPVAQRLAQALGVSVDQRADALVERGVGGDVGYDLCRDGRRAASASDARRQPKARRRPARSR